MLATKLSTCEGWLLVPLGRVKQVIRWQFCEVFLRVEVVLTAEYLTLFVEVTILFKKVRLGSV